MSHTHEPSSCRHTRYESCNVCCPCADGVRCPTAPDPALPADRLQEIRAHSDAGSADWPDPIGDARELLDEVERLRGEANDWAEAARNQRLRAEQAEAERDALRERLARVEAAAHQHFGYDPKWLCDALKGGRRCVTSSASPNTQTTTAPSCGGAA